MGEMKGISPAERLKMKSDAQHTSLISQMFGEFFTEIMREAEHAAEAGLYEATIYAANLDNSAVVLMLKRTLKSHGFQVYSGWAGGLGKTNPGQPFLTISWK